MDLHPLEAGFIAIGLLCVYHAVVEFPEPMAIAVGGAGAMFLFIVAHVRYTTRPDPDA